MTETPTLTVRTLRARLAAARDFGGVVTRLPSRIDRPATAAGVVAVLRDAAGVDIAVRGGGHGVAGRCTTTGRVLDMSGLGAIETGDGVVTVGAGVTWGRLLAATLARGLLPPVVPDSPLPSVVGTAIAGGYGEASIVAGTVAGAVVAVEWATAGGVDRAGSDGAGTVLAACRVGGGAVVTALTLPLVALDGPAAPVTRRRGHLRELLDLARAPGADAAVGTAVECLAPAMAGELVMRWPAVAAPLEAVAEPWAAYLDRAGPRVTARPHDVRPCVSLLVPDETLDGLVAALGTGDGLRRVLLRPVGGRGAARRWLVDLIRVLPPGDTAAIAAALDANRRAGALAAVLGGEIYAGFSILSAA